METSTNNNNGVGFSDHTSWDDGVEYLLFMFTTVIGR